MFQFTVLKKFGSSLQRNTYSFRLEQSLMELVKAYDLAGAPRRTFARNSIGKPSGASPMRPDRAPEPRTICTCSSELWPFIST